MKLSRKTSAALRRYHEQKQVHKVRGFAPNRLRTCSYVTVPQTHYRSPMKLTDGKRHPMRYDVKLVSLLGFLPAYEQNPFTR